MKEFQKNIIFVEYIQQSQVTFECWIIKQNPISAKETTNFGFYCCSQLLGFVVKSQDVMKGMSGCERSNHQNDNITWKTNWNDLYVCMLFNTYSSFYIHDSWFILCFLFSSLQLWHWRLNISFAALARFTPSDSQSRFMVHREVVHRRPKAWYQSKVNEIAWEHCTLLALQPRKQLVALVHGGLYYPLM